MAKNGKKSKSLIASGIWCVVAVVVLFGYLGMVMGVPNMLNTIMKTAHDLLLNTVLYLMSICVITGAMGRVFVEFGVVALLERTLRPLMRPIFNLPGVTSLGAVMTFLSDNPAIISLAKDKRFASYFKKYQFISLTNFGTAFGMGLLVIVFMASQGYYAAPITGRCMLWMRVFHTPDAALRVEGLSAVCRGRRCAERGDRRKGGGKREDGADRVHTPAQCHARRRTQRC